MSGVVCDALGVKFKCLNKDKNIFGRAQLQIKLGKLGNKISILLNYSFFTLF